LHHRTDNRARLRTNLRTIFVEGVSFSVMVGIGETYLPAFVLALGMGEVASGLIATIPLVAGGILQLGTPLGIRIVGSHRRWAVLGAGVQAATFIPLIAGAVLGRIPGSLVFIFAALYWASGMAIGPAWNVWVERLIPPSIRTGYFARRTSATNIGVLAGLLAGGLILDHTHALAGFAVLFAVAGLSRFTSAALLHSQSDADVPPMFQQPREVLATMRRFPRSAGGALIGYMLFLTGAVTIASPFFTAFMLRPLGLSYAQYMGLLVTALAGKAVALPLFAQFARRWGLARLLRAGWLGITIVPPLWLLSDSYPYLVGLQIFAGAAWAAHEYVTFLWLFEMIGASERGTLLTAYNLGNALASAGGSLLGGFMFDAAGGGMAGYYVIFGVSSAVRVLGLVVLLRIPGVRLPTLPVVFRTIAVRPSMGVVIRPILATLRPQWTAKRRRDTDGSEASKTR